MYRIRDIMPRHFLESAAQAGMPTTVVQSILDELAQNIPAAIDTVCNTLPDDFPEDIRDAICDATRKRLRRIHLKLITGSDLRM